MTDKTNIRGLIRKALEMRKFSYVPYSGFAVGAALLAGEIYVYKMHKPRRKKEKGKTH